MRRSFKPMPADEIEDEDERCRVRHDAFVRRQARKRPSEFWFYIFVAGFVIVIGAVLCFVSTSPR